LGSDLGVLDRERAFGIHLALRLGAASEPANWTAGAGGRAACDGGLPFVTAVAAPPPDLEAGPGPELLGVEPRVLGGVQLSDQAGMACRQ
jgi:hypothetical protein